ncbi:MAG: hypothetical protein ACI83P_001720 [Janthinobacterium sp.]|jgi:hypothetical protein
MKFINMKIHVMKFKRPILFGNVFKNGVPEDSALDCFLPGVGRRGAGLRCCFLAALIALIGAGPALAAPLLRCQMDQGGSTQVLEFAPAGDPYVARAIDINGRFRFKAVVIGDLHGIEYIKLYTYSQSRRSPVLLHVAKYMAPAVQQGTSYSALTGVNYIYSPQLERELQYGCALIEVTR